jgi:hypothetical protein
LDVDLGKPLTELSKLWDRSHVLLWAFAIASFLGFVVLAAIALTGSATFVEANNTASPWLLLASIIFAVFAALKHYQERTIQTVRLVPIEPQSVYGVTTQTDGRLTTQISARMDVFNISEKSIWLSGLKLLRPRSHAPVLNRVVTLKDQSSAYHGVYELPPGAKTDGSVLLIIQEDLTDQIARKGVKLCIEDQFGHRHNLKLSNLRRA